MWSTRFCSKWAKCGDFYRAVCAATTFQSWYHQICFHVVYIRGTFCHLQSKSKNYHTVAVLANVQVLTPTQVGQHCSCCRRLPCPAAPWSSSLPAPLGFPRHPGPPPKVCWGALPCERETVGLESVQSGSAKNWETHPRIISWAAGQRNQTVNV